MTTKFWSMDIRVNENTVIVFDLDDTLYNEVDYLRSAYMFIAKRLDPENWQALFGCIFSRFRSQQNAFEYITANYPVEKGKLLEIYRSHVPLSLQPFDGVLETLQRIKERKGKIGIITDGRKSTQRVKLKALGILELIDKIVISEEISSEKPNEKNYQIVMETFKNCEYFYIADNLRKDFISPNKLGWQTLGLVDNGLNVHYDSYLYFNQTHSPNKFVTSFKEIKII